MDETPTPTPAIYRYEFYVRVQNGVNPQPMITVVSTQPVDSPEVRTAIEQVRGQLAMQPGVGLVPRPSYYTATELHPMPAAYDEAKRSSALIVPINGAKG